MADQLDIHQTTTRLALTYQSVATAQRSLSGVRENWPSELNEYLHDEKYGGMNVDDFTDRVLTSLEEISGPLSQLSKDLYSLSNDLISVGRGDGFRV